MDSISGFRIDEGVGEEGAASYPPANHSSASDSLRCLADACEMLMIPANAPNLQINEEHSEFDVVHERVMPVTSGHLEQSVHLPSVDQEQSTQATMGNAESYRRRVTGGRRGQDARFAPGLATAISRAVSRAADRQTEQIFYPHLSMQFNSAEEAREFYNLYSWEVGFGIRTGRSAKNGNSYRIRIDFVCSCEGHDPNPNSASSRSGCKASLRLLRTEDDGWFVSRLVDEHNHPLSEGYAEKKQWKSHSDIDPTTKSFIKSLRENNVTLGKVCSILQSGSVVSSQHAFRKEAIRSLSARLSQESIRDDISKTVKLLQELKASDPDLSVALDVDNQGTIINMLWCNGKNKQDYSDFGDVVTFDTTYRTNLYNMPFGLFVGVNNHFQSVIFGGVLFSRETTAAFEWAFRTFVETMGGKAPVTILTDQAVAMEGAIRKSLPTTKHRWCRWHVLRFAKEKIGSKYSKFCGFKKEFHRLVTDVLSKKKFECDWKRLVQKYGLQKNKFLARIFKDREKWAKPYFMGIFCAGMTSTQRSESANHMLKSHIPRASPMHLFVRKYNDFLQNRNDDEARERHVTKQKRRVLRINVPIEKHAREVYTRAMFVKFGDELYESGCFSIKKTKGPGNYTVIDTTDTVHDRSNEFHVSMNSEGSKISCSCGFMDHIGMPCRHALKVLVHLDIAEIPSANIHHRWTKEASTAAISTLDPNCLPARAIASSGLQENIILIAALNLVKTASSTGTPLDVALKAIEVARSTVTEASLVSRLHETNGATSSSITSNPLLKITSGDKPYEQGTSTLVCPKRRVIPGRPAFTRLKSWKEKSRKRNETRPAATGAEATTDDVNSITRTKAVSELMGPECKRSRLN